MLAAAAEEEYQCEDARAHLWSWAAAPVPPAAGGAETRAKLQALDGDAFDRAYVDNEVAYHEAVIGVLKTQLIPAATNPELAKTLVSVQPAFDAHLAHAKQVQAALAGGGSAAPAHDHMP